jgi:hypothetical protein
VLAIITRGSNEYPSISEIANYVEHVTDEQKLHNLFYHSLFDFTAQDFEAAYTIDQLNNHVTELKDLLCDVFNTDRFWTDEECYDWFNKYIISPDPLCKIILRKQLYALGLPIDPITKVDKAGQCDLRVPEKNIFIELKRVTGWYNYKKYFSDFLSKTRANRNYVYAVVAAYPPDVRDVITRLNPDDSRTLENHIRQIIRAHFVVEIWLAEQKGRNIKFVLEFLKLPKSDESTDEDLNNGKDRDSLTHVCGLINQKIEEFESAK